MADTTAVQVRYFAAASDAAGCVKETLDLPAGASLADLESVIVERHGDRMRRVLSVAAFLVEDDLTRDRTVLAGPAVDVLPPFAGG